MSFKQIDERLQKIEVIAMDLKKRLQAIEERLAVKEYEARVLFFSRIGAGEVRKAEAEKIGMGWERLDGEGLEEFQQRVEADIVATVPPSRGKKQVFQIVSLTP